MDHVAGTGEIGRHAQLKHAGDRADGNNFEYLRGHVLTAVAQAPFIATLPTRIAKRYARMFGLVICEVPIDLQVAPIAMVWAAHADKEPAFEWIREQVCPTIAAAQQL